MTVVALNSLSSFQLSTVGPGAIATGLEDLRQCIDFILRTVKGSDPLRPEFGSDVFLFTDYPHITAIPNIKKSIFEALDLWEKRIIVETITHEVNGESLLFNISFSTVGGDIAETLSWSIGGIVQSSDGIGSSGTIITALIPAKVVNGRYNILFIVDNIPALPVTPSVGFASAAEMLVWVNTNWFNYGKWYLTAGKLVLYLNSGIVKTAKLAVTQVSVISIKVLLPQLLPGEFFQVSFTANSANPLPVFPENTLSTLEQLLFWLQTNWSQYGTWNVQTENANIDYEGDFTDDFSDDFNIGSGVQVNRYIVFQSDLLETATLNIN